MQNQKVELSDVIAVIRQESIIEAEKHECPCIVSYGCAILRSKYKIPKPLTGLTKGAIV